MKIGLALGGGGARGAVHIGALMELERLGIRPDIVTGTSIGGLIAGFLAAGFSPAEMKGFMEEIDLGHLYALPGEKPALINNSKFEQLLEETLGRITFADLEIPLAVVAVDLARRREIVLDEGDLVSALLATTAFPVLLPPVEREGLTLVDGGLVNNVPFDVARARGATYVMAIDLSQSAPYGTAVDIPAGSGIVSRALAMTQRRPIWRVLTTVADILTTQSVKARIAISAPDLHIRPHVGTIGIFDFHRLEEGIAIGRQAIQEIEEKLQRLLLEEE